MEMLQAFGSIQCQCFLHFFIVSVVVFLSPEHYTYFSLCLHRRLWLPHPSPRHVSGFVSSAAVSDSGPHLPSLWLPVPALCGRCQRNRTNATPQLLEGIPVSCTG